MIDHGALGAFRWGRARLADDQKHAGKLEKFKRTGVGHFGAENADPELLLDFGVGHHQVDVAQGDSAFVRRGQLGKQRKGGNRNQEDPSHGR